MHKRFLGSALVSTLLVAGLTSMASAGPAHAGSCSYNGRYATQDFSTPQGTYVGYVELLYASACRSVEAHFHVDSTFRAGHSGWNVDLSLLNNKQAPRTVKNTAASNSSAVDFNTPPASIDGYSSMQFTAFLGWVYNSCSIDATSSWWDFHAGSSSANTMGSVNC